MRRKLFSGITPAVIGALIFGIVVGGVFGQAPVKTAGQGGGSKILVAAKKIFGVGEQPVLKLRVGSSAVSWWGAGEADAAEKVATEVDYDSHKVDVPVEVLPASGGDYTLKLKPTGQIKPGKYTVTAKWGSGADQTATQTFAWGVLSVNTTQPAYLPGETAKIQMAVLSSTGHTICAAPVTLTVYAPEGTSTMPVVHNSPVCKGDTYVQEPDYSSTYTVGKVGHYRLVFRMAETDYQLEAGFEVSDHLPFRIERTAPTRLFPPAIYSNIIKVRPNADFVGTVTEQLPEGFSIFNVTTGAVKGASVTWRVNWQKGKDYELSYGFKAPDKSPAFYESSPLKFSLGGKTVYQEPRSWQMAGDAVIAFVKQTVKNVTTAASSDTTSTTSTGGDTLILIVNIGSPTTTLATSGGITDSASNAWNYTTNVPDTSLPSDVTPSTNDYFTMAYVTNASAITSITVAITSSQQYAYNLVEFSNITSSSPVEQSASDHAGSNTTFTSPIITTATAGDLIIGGLATSITAPSLNQAGSAPTSGWTTLTNTNATATQAAGAYLVSPGTGNFKQTWTLGTSHPAAYGIMAFKAGTGGSGGGTCTQGGTINLVKQLAVSIPGGATSDTGRSFTTTAGDTLILFIQVDNSTVRLSSVTDSASNTWTVPGAPPVQNPPANTSASLEGAMAYALNIAATTTITVTLSSAQIFSYTVMEFSNIASASAVDQSASASAASSTSITTPSVTTANAGDMIIAFEANSNEAGTINQGSSSPTSGWVQLTGNSGGSTKGFSDGAYQIVSATGTYSANFTLATAHSAATGTMAFKSKATTVVTQDMLMRGGTYFDNCGKEPYFWAN